MRAFLAALVLTLGTTAGDAATIDAMGATGVKVGGKYYDVSFVDGSCRDVFGT